MRLGVFDSGIGGEAVAASLREAFPEAVIDTLNDRANVPYGDKTPDEVVQLTTQAIQPFLTDNYDAIILACNTATAYAIEPLRRAYPSQLFIGIEPMIKSAAAQTKTNIITVCATPATLASERYSALVAQFGAHLDIIQPDCSQWASLIENNQMNKGVIKSVVEDACHRGADVIVLGCTHYHWIKESIIELAGDRAGVLEPSDAIGLRVQQLIQKL